MVVFTINPKIRTSEFNEFLEVIGDMITRLEIKSSRLEKRVTELEQQIKSLKEQESTQ